MPQQRPTLDLPPPVIAAAGFLLPGLGYWLIGERVRGYIAGVTIITLFVLGLLIGGIRVVDVPGYLDNGSRRVINVGGQPQWLLTARPFAAIMDKPWFVGQVLAGPLALVTATISVNVAASVPKATARLPEIGTLYTAVAGMLNLLVLMDAAHRSGRPSRRNRQ